MIKFYEQKITEKSKNRSEQLLAVLYERFLLQ